MQTDLSILVGNAFGIWLLLDGYASEVKGLSKKKLKEKERKIGNGERLAIYHKKGRENLIICLETGLMCDNAAARYNIFLQQWLRKGAEFTKELNAKADQLAEKMGLKDEQH